LPIIIRIARCDFKMTFKDRSVIIWTFLMPLAFIAIFGFAFRERSSSQVRAKLTIENSDVGFLSVELIEALRKENLNIVDSLSEGESAVRTLVIPEGFTESLLKRERVTLVLRRDPGSNLEAGEAVSVSIFKGLIRVISGLVELEGNALEQGSERFRLSDNTLSGSLWNLVRGNEAGIESLHVELDSLQAREQLVKVEASLAGRASRPPPGGFQSSVPGNMVTFVLMAMLFGGIGITAERTGGILRRFGISPVDRSEVVAGKLLARMMVAGLQIAFLLVVGRALFGIDLGKSPAALIVLMIAFAFCTGAFSIMFGSFFRDPDQVAGFAIITTLAMAALGGCWWPIEIVSRPFQIIAFCLPTGWAIHGIHRIISFGHGFDAIAANIAVLVAFGLAFVAAASKKLRWTI